MEERGQFTFYRSFWEAVQGLPKKDRLPILEAIIAYALDGEEPKGLSQAQGAFFLLCKPTLDSSRKKATNGKQGGKNSKANAKQSASKTEANAKQSASEKEKEKEIEIENEIEYEEEKEKEIKTPAAEEANAEQMLGNDEEALGVVMSTYMDKINPSPSSAVTAELSHCVALLGGEVVLHAIGIAIDERKLGWSYLQAILRRYRQEGLTSLSAVLTAEQRWQEQKGRTQGKNASRYDWMDGVVLE